MKKIMITLFVVGLMVGCSKDDDPANNVNNQNNQNNANNGSNNGTNQNNANNANNGSNNVNNANNVNNQNNVQETGMQGDPCTCDQAMDPDGGHSFCQTQTDGCEGLFDYACFFEVATLTGVCRIQCGEAEYMTQGSCPAGTICERYESTIHTPEMPSYFYGCN